jgi:tripartite-type tricarboxylate transporter receptor subunit TctC
MMSKTVRKLVALLLCAACTAGAADADEFPSKPIRWLVGYPAGGGTDTVARVVTAAMASELKQTIVIENKPGASANIAGAELVHSAPDGIE